MITRPAIWDANLPTDDVRLTTFFGQVMEFVLQHGQAALDAMEDLDAEHAPLLGELIERGLLDTVQGRYRLTEQAVWAIERGALAEIVARLKAGRPAGQPAAARPNLLDPTLDDADLTAALKNVMLRTGQDCPIPIREQDLDSVLAQCRWSTAIALLLDMSGSMARLGRFYQAKRAALALHALARQRYPNDTIDVIGFYSVAERIDRERLPLLLPKAVSLADGRVSMRVKLARAASAPQHFTNLQMALRLAREVLERRDAENRLVLLITDGEPTAHVDGRDLCLEYPPDHRSLDAALAEAKPLVDARISLAAFALIDDYAETDWVGFLDELTRLTRGVGFYCDSGDLAGCVLESYLSAKMKKAYTA